MESINIAGFDAGVDMWSGGGKRVLYDLAVGADAGFGHVEDSFGVARHASADALGEEAHIFDQAGVPGHLVGALEKLAQIQGLAGDLIYHGIGLFLG